LETPSSTQLANLLLLAPKPVPHAPSPSETRKDLLIGSATLVVGSDAGYHGLRGYTKLPDWVELGQEPDPSLRTEDVKPDTSSNTTSMTAGDRLDKALREHKTTSISSRARNGPAMPLDPAGKKTLDQWLEEEEEETETESGTDSGEEETDSEEEETDSEEESGSEEDEDESEEETDSETEAVHKEAQQLLG
jgi:hypothetical protein